MADAINIPIVSKYDDKGAKAALKDAQALDKAKPEIKVTADTKAAERDITGLMKKADQLTSEAAEILLTSNATAIAKEITGLIGDIDKLDADDPEVTVKSDQINKLTGDLDQVKAKIRDVADTPVDIDTKPAQKGIDDVGKSADSSKSVLANMVGNSTQDLGALGGVAGSAGVAIGQMGEYMADARAEGEGFGSIATNFASIAGPIAALSLAMKGVADVSDRFGQSQKRTADSVDVFADALRSGDSTVDAYKAAVKDANGVILDITRNQSALVNTLGELDSHWYSTGIGVHLLTDLLHGGGKETENITGLINKAGISLDQFAAASVGGADEQAQMAKALSGTTLSADEQNKILDKLKNNQEDNTAATKNHAETQKLLGVESERYGKMLADQERKLAASTAATEIKTRADQDAADMIDRVNTLLNDQATALNEQVDAALASADATFAASDAQDDFVKSAQDTTAAESDVAKAIKEHGAQSQEAKDATEALNAAVKTERDAMVNSANAAARLADEQAKASGTTLSAQQKIDTFNDSLLSNARYATPQARAAIADYIVTANNVPPDKSTDIKAAINAGDFATARTLLDQASATRTAAIKADADTAAAERELGPQGVSRPRTSEVTANVTVRGITAIGGGQFRLPNGVIVSKHGGTIPEGWSGLAGEAGPEFAEFGGQRFLLTGPTIVPPGTQITSTAASARILERELSGPITNVSINLPRGTRPDDAVRAADRYARRNGRPRAHR